MVGFTGIIFGVSEYISGVGLNDNENAQIKGKDRKITYSIRRNDFDDLKNNFFNLYFIN